MNLKSFQTPLIGRTHFVDNLAKERESLLTSTFTCIFADLSPRFPFPASRYPSHSFSPSPRRHRHVLLLKIDGISKQWSTNKAKLDSATRQLNITKELEELTVIEVQELQENILRVRSSIEDLVHKISQQRFAERQVGEREITRIQGM